MKGINFAGLAGLLSSFSSMVVDITWRKPIDFDQMVGKRLFTDELIVN